MNIRYASLTDVGVRRSHNQDACATQPASDASVFRTQGHVFIVADGMGGHAVGEKASAKAVRDIPLTYLKHVVHEGPAAAIRRAFREANEAIYGIGQNNPEFKGLGTTGTALFLRSEGAWLGHVGDSRAYRIRGNRIQQLTFDHSWVWEVARRQGIDPDELGDFKKNVIIRSLGPDAEVEADLEGPHPLEPGDRFLLCSDGLSNVVPADELAAVASTFPPDEACRYLVALANLRGGPDNITCLIVQAPGGPGDGSESTRRRGVFGLIRRAAVGWNRFVPWAFTTLGAGVLAAGVSVWLRAEGIPGAVGAFGAAAILILTGLVGLYLHLRLRAEQTSDDPGYVPQELRLYRDYAFEIGKPLVDRFVDMDSSLIEVLKDQDIGEVRETHVKYSAEAAEATGRGDWAAAFRAQFQALQVLAAVYHQHRHKDEVFQPNWVTKTRAAQ
ncbi:Protein serine/threonine phosphatase PrpC, regulation of stationary phase [Fimbriiglobus ruber]|uniref:Protein serine/threonine phosphatase PrpC, regulation of stationary phase n=1 Tax=Fimbriiglobus ruber TaxID=1908690 RepID=A0A225DCL4_9BACT|nr:Protein serine/threonine phosphatase PrpC, regulation of stationary phase [Fimbriiglobus ruber]